MKYRKKPALIEATQWFRNGDHPQDWSEPVDTEHGSGSGRRTEGKVVKFFRRLNVPGARFCPDCGNVFQKHGLLNGLNDEEVVCPGDYIVTHPKGHYYVLKSVDFEALYEPYEIVATPPPKVKDAPKKPNQGPSQKRAGAAATPSGGSNDRKS